MWYQYDGCPIHYSTCARVELDKMFSGHRISRRGTVEWTPCSPGNTPLDFYLWDKLKESFTIKRTYHTGRSQGKNCSCIFDNNVAGIG